MWLSLLLGTGVNSHEQRAFCTTFGVTRCAARWCPRWRSKHRREMVANGWKGLYLLLVRFSWVVPPPAAGTGEKLQMFVVVVVVVVPVVEARAERSGHSVGG